MDVILITVIILITAARKRDIQVRKMEVTIEELMRILRKKLRDGGLLQFSVCVRAEDMKKLRELSDKLEIER